MFSAIKAYFGHLLEVPDAVSPARYRSLRRIMTILMVTVSVTPLLILTGINHAQYMSTWNGRWRTRSTPWCANRRPRWSFPRRAGLHRQSDRPCLQL